MELKHDIRVLAGTNEENGMEDAAYYTGNCQCPDFTIVVDSPFPFMLWRKRDYRSVDGIGLSFFRACDQYDWWDCF